MPHLSSSRRLPAGDFIWCGGKRVLLAFRRTFADGQNGIQDDELLIETEPRVYTEAYRLLTKDFYLSF